MSFLRTASLIVIAIAATTLLGLATASAHTVAGLQVEFADHLDERLQDEIEEELARFFNDSYRYDWIAPAEVARLLGGAPDCFDTECLAEYGLSLEARVGLRIIVDEEAQFYDLELHFYDLDDGKALATEEASCELCGRAEVINQFRTSLQTTLALLNIDDRPTLPIGSVVELDEGITELRISVIPSDTRIFLDEEPVGVGEASIPLDEGTYEVRFSHDTHHGLRETLIVSEDSAPLFIMRVHLRHGSEGMQRTVVTRGDGLVDQIEDHRVTIGATALGVGAGLTIASFILAGLHGQPACSADVPVHRCPDVYRTSGLAMTTTIIGTLSIAGGAALIAWPWLAGSTREPTEAGVDVAPTVGSGFGGLSIQGRF